MERLDTYILREHFKHIKSVSYVRVCKSQLLDYASNLNVRAKDKKRGAQPASELELTLTSLETRRVDTPRHSRQADVPWTLKSEVIEKVCAFENSYSSRCVTAAKFHRRHSRVHPGAS